MANKYGMVTLKIGDLNKPAPASGYVYTPEAVQAAIDKLPKGPDGKHYPIFGQAGRCKEINPFELRPDVGNYTHHVSNIMINGEDVIGDVKFLDTHMGKFLAEAIEQKIVYLTMEGTCKLVDNCVTDYRIMTVTAYTKPSYEHSNN